MRNSSGNQSLLDPTQTGNPTWIYIWVFYHKYNNKKKYLGLRYSKCALLNGILSHSLSHGDGGQIVKRETDIISIYTQTTDINFSLSGKCL